MFDLTLHEVAVALALVQQTFSDFYFYCFTSFTVLVLLPFQMAQTAVLALEMVRSSFTL